MNVYCRYCESTLIPKIWADHADKLPKEKTIENLMDHWDLLGLSWMQNDILGCIIPNNPGKALVIQFWDPVCKQLS